MQIERSEQGRFTMLSIEGAVHLGESGRQVSDALDAELEQGTSHVLVEMSRIDYMDSTGVGELVGYLCRLNETGRRLILVGPPDRIRKLLEVTRLDSQFRIYDTVDEAIAGES